MSKFISDEDMEKIDPAKSRGFISDDQMKALDAPKYNATQSAVMHGLNSATGGFSDELQGLGEAAGRVVGVEGAGGPMKDMGMAKGGPTIDWETLRDAYKAARDHERQALSQQSKEHPAASAVGDVAGMVASPLNKVVGGMSIAKGGAVLGGVNALGNTEKEDAPGMLEDTALGAGLGFGIGKVAGAASPYLEKGLEKAGSGARSLAEKFGARAMGAERGTIKSLGIDKVKAAAGQMLDNGGFSSLGSTEDMMAKNAALKAQGGEMMGKAYKAIDDAGASTFNPLDVASKVDSQLGGFYRSPINKGVTGQLENTLESILMRGEKNIPLSEAQALKEELKQVANWKNTLNPTEKEIMARKAYGIVNGAIDDAVASGSKVVDQAGLSETLANGKELYGKAATGEKLLENRQAREQGNSIIGLTDAITGAGALGYGGTTGDWKGAGAVVLAKKGLQKYGAQNAALGLNKVSQMLMRSPSFASLAERSPQAFNSLASNFAKKLAPAEALQKVAGPDQAPIDDDKAKQSFLEGN